eukprot:jgi/Mesvir1/22880/Mv19405-RA.1
MPDPGVLWKTQEAAELAALRHPSMDCARLCGWARLCFKRGTKNGNTEAQLLKRLGAPVRISRRGVPGSRNSTSADCVEFWDKNGEPGSENLIPVHRLVEACLDGSLLCEQPWGLAWMQHVMDLLSPASLWKMPLIRAVCPCPDAFEPPDWSDGEEGASGGAGGEDDESVLNVVVYIYLGRLIFELIACESVKGVMEHLEPVSHVRACEKVKDHPATYVSSLSAVAETSAGYAFTMPGLIKSCEHTGCPEAAEPQGLRLSMLPYQRQSLHWMREQEQRPGGINRLFWEARWWAPPELPPKKRSGPSQANGYAPMGSGWGPVPAAVAQADDVWFYFPEAGELRLHVPPMVTGGMVAEEMGLGKTLEMLALILADKQAGRPPPLDTWHHERLREAQDLAAWRRQLAMDAWRYKGTARKKRLDAAGALAGQELSQQARRDAEAAGWDLSANGSRIDSDDSDEDSDEDSDDDDDDSSSMDEDEEGGWGASDYGSGSGPDSEEDGEGPSDADGGLGHRDNRARVPVSGKRKRRDSGVRHGGQKRGGGGQWGRGVRKGRPPPLASAASLIIVPVTLLGQWKHEFCKSLEPGKLSVVSYHADCVERINTSLPPEQCRPTFRRQEDLLACLASADVVLTTYRLLQQDAEGGPHRGGNRKKKILTRIKWHRIVLDECQEIRSSTTLLARACENLPSTHRWMVSGTPLYNSIDDLNGELQFLRVWPFSFHDSTDGFWEFKIGNPWAAKDPAALDLLHLLLRGVMIRHSKSQRTLPSLGGLPLLQLPASRSLVRPVLLDASPSDKYVIAFMERAAVDELRSQHILGPLTSEIPEAERATSRAHRQMRATVTQMLRLARAPCTSVSLLALSEVDHLLRRSINREGAQTAYAQTGSDGLVMMDAATALRVLMQPLAVEAAGPFVRHADTHHGLYNRQRAYATQTVAEKLEEATQRATLIEGELRLKAEVPFLRWQWLVEAVTSGSCVLSLRRTSLRHLRRLVETLQLMRDVERAERGVAGASSQLDSGSSLHPGGSLSGHESRTPGKRGVVLAAEMGETVWGQESTGELGPGDEDGRAVADREVVREAKERLRALAPTGWRAEGGDKKAHKLRGLRLTLQKRIADYLSRSARASEELAALLPYITLLRHAKGAGGAQLAAGVVEQSGFQGLNDLMEGRLPTCLICHGPISEPTVTRCVHLACAKCICRWLDAAPVLHGAYQTAHSSVLRGGAPPERVAPCPLCRKPFMASDLIKVTVPPPRDETGGAGGAAGEATTSSAGGATPRKGSTVTVDRRGKRAMANGGEETAAASTPPKPSSGADRGKEPGTPVGPAPSASPSSLVVREPTRIPAWCDPVDSAPTSAIDGPACASVSEEERRRRMVLALDAVADARYFPTVEESALLALQGVGLPYGAAVSRDPRYPSLTIPFLSHWHVAHAGMSPKLAAVVRDLRQLWWQGTSAIEPSGGHPVLEKVVIYSQAKESLAKLGKVLASEGIGFARIVPGMPEQERQVALQTFNDDPACPVFLLHVGTAAAGLTLTRARKVLLLEPFLSPGDEAQAANRCHRIGQRHVVDVVTYFVKGTVEERVLAFNRRQQQHHHHAAGAADPGVSSGGLPGSKPMTGACSSMAGSRRDGSSKSGKGIGGQSTSQDGETAEASRHVAQAPVDAEPEDADLLSVMTTGVGQELVSSREQLQFLLGETDMSFVS